MQKYWLSLVAVGSLLACTMPPAKHNSERKPLASVPQANAKVIDSTDSFKVLPRQQQDSIRINGKKFLRDRNGEKWRLYDVEFSQYVVATTRLVLQTDNLQAALAAASLTDTSVTWRKIALNTYQAEIEMSKIEVIYRSLIKAQQQVEWILDYSQYKQAETM